MICFGNCAQSILTINKTFKKTQNNNKVVNIQLIIEITSIYHLTAGSIL